MLDPRPDLALQAVPDFCHTDDISNIPVSSSRFLSNFKSSSSFFWRHSRQLQSRFSYHDDLLTRINPHGFSPYTHSFYSCHHLAQTDPRTNCRDNFSRVSQENTSANNLLKGEHFAQRIFSGLTLPHDVMDKRLLFKSVLDPAESLHCSGRYHPREGLELNKCLMYDLKASSIVSSFHDTVNNIQKKCMEEVGSDRFRESTKSLNHFEERQRWQRSEFHPAQGRGNRLRAEENVTSASETVNAHDMRNRARANAQCFPREYVEELSTNPSKCLSSTYMGAPVVSVPPSSPTTNKACRSSPNALTQPVTPQRSVSGLKEDIAKRTNRKMYLRKIKTGFKKIGRPKCARDDTVTKQGESSRTSSDSVAVKKSKVRFAHRRTNEHIQGEISPMEDDDRKAFKCSQCRYVTDRKNNLKRHVITMHHKTTRILECCGTIFHSKASLRDHVTLYHRGGYRCQVCGRNFCRKALLRRHLTVHSGQKDFACDLCGYATSHKSNLERHQRVHARKSSLFGHDFPPQPMDEEPKMSSERYTEKASPDNDSNTTNANNMLVDNFPCGKSEYEHLSYEQVNYADLQKSSPFDTENRTPGYNLGAEQFFQHENSTPIHVHNYFSLSGALNDEKTDTSSNEGTIVNSESNSSTLPTNPVDKADLLSSLTEANSSISSDSLCLNSGKTFQANCSAINSSDYFRNKALVALPQSVVSHSDADEVETTTTILRNQTKASARERTIPKKGRFPNRLKETYLSNENTTNSQCTPVSEVCTGDEKLDLAEHVEGDHYNVDKNIRKDENSSQNSQLVEASASSRPERGNINTRELPKTGSKNVCGESKGSELQTKLRMCNLPYRCFSCSVCFTHQEELRDHECTLGPGPCMLDFPLISSVMKGCIKLAEFEDAGN